MLYILAFTHNFLSFWMLHDIWRCIGVVSALLDQVTLLSEAFFGATVAAREAVSPSVIPMVCRSRVTPVTLMVVGTGSSFSSLPHPEIARIAIAKAINADNRLFIFIDMRERHKRDIVNQNQGRSNHPKVSTFSREGHTISNRKNRL